ncbi:sensor histidine kinase [Azospirillum thermophilum]|uniref:histidine kinase n=1 Tax=Azospirillum thermophilum TaxID=2202148 RepID=A0A2S2CWN7_9PROT|nr:HAMP domain-containing sensor histidine kinase [Azospirillum thermophilum]AWK88922.1 sensor histidine kinase [Azospirillum thermophilum]
MARAIAGLDAALAARLSPLSAARPVAAGRATEALFEEMSRLNNELSTAQRALAKANAELAASNEQKNRLMGMLAHDLRSPLQVIAGFAELLEDRVAGRLDATERSCLERIRESSLFMRHLVEDALSLASLEAGRLRLTRQPVDLALLARRNVAMNAVLAEGKGVAIALEAEEGLPQAMLDSGKTEQVMNNLLSNAIKFSHRGGRVRVGVAAGAEGWQRLSVADEGRGMSEAERARLFQPFTRSGTLGTAGEGTVGLGLYICRTIVEGHGGRIQVDSAPGAGATFTVELPVRGPAEA